MRISKHQRLILEALEQADHGFVTSQQLHHTLWGNDWPRTWGRDRLPANHRSSLSRSLKRLVAAGLIERLPARGAVRLTNRNHGCEKLTDGVDKGGTL